MENDRKKQAGSLLTFFGGSSQLIVVVLLVVAAYLIGSLKTKVDILEKGGGTQVAAGAGAAAQPQAALPNPTPGDVPKITADDHIRGNKNAEVVLIEYSDTECPFCKRFHPTMKQALDEYKDKVQWVYRHYPLSFHQNAQKQAEASECAKELGGIDAFWKYLDAVYDRTTSNGTGFAMDALAPLAKEIGLNDVAFKTCLDSGKYAKKVQEQMDGGTKAGVQGTPGTVVMNTKTGKAELVSGAVPYTDLKTAIENVLK